MVGVHEPWEPDLDLGDGHSLIWTTWEPDRELNPQYDHVPRLGVYEHFGAIIRHPAGPNATKWSEKWLGEGICEGGITFSTPTSQALATMGAIRNVLWTVFSWNPLDISPSVLCSCGDHGFIRAGRWQCA